MKKTYRVFMTVTEIQTVEVNAYNEDEAVDLAMGGHGKDIITGCGEIDRTVNDITEVEND